MAQPLCVVPIDAAALAPLLAPAAASVVLLFAIALRRNLRWAAGIALGGLVLALALLPLAWARAPREVGTILMVDRFAVFYWGLIFSTGAVVACFAHGYLKRRDLEREEFFLLLLLASVGSAVIASSGHFFSFFLGLELLGAALYTLIAYLPESERSLEAGLKYLVLAGASSAFLLFGMALVYAHSGSLRIPSPGVAEADPDGQHLLILAGLGLIAVAACFKLAVAPFHLWTPDIYQGAPAPGAAFVATASKGSLVALLLRAFAPLERELWEPLWNALAVISIASMLAGNLLALTQANVKRILAYSSIAHLGYLLVAFLAGGNTGVRAATFYLVVYLTTVLGAFGVVTVLSSSERERGGDREREADELGDYRGLAWRRPWLAAGFTVMLLSLAGLPLTAGLIGKLYLFTAGIHARLWLPVAALVVSSAIGIFYYLRVVGVLFQPLESEYAAVFPRSAARAGPPPRLSLAGGLVAALALVVVLLGVYPQPVLSLIGLAAAGIAGR